MAFISPRVRLLSLSRMGCGATFSGKVGICGIWSFWIFWICISSTFALFVVSFKSVLMSGNGGILGT